MVQQIKIQMQAKYVGTLGRAFYLCLLGCGTSIPLGQDRDGDGPLCFLGSASFTCLVNNLKYTEVDSMGV
jgi:hypothetical protein